LIERMPDAGVRELLRTLFRRGHVGSELAREALDAHWHFYEQSPDGAGAALVRQARSLDPMDAEAVAQGLPMLGLPTSIVWGSADRFQKYAAAKRLASDLAAPLDRVAGARHFVPEDHPEHVASATRQLLEEIRRRGGLREVGTSSR
jgi:pimeloyl-ACP methyl ester carboxylesterase